MSDEIDHIAELQKRLYARDPESVPKRKFGILRPLKHNVASTWGETELEHDKPVKRTSVSGYKRFFIFSFFFFLVAFAVLAFSVYRGALTLSAKNVDLVVLGSSFVAGGEELPIQVEIVNKNSSDLVNATLTLDYPKGATDVAGSDVVHIEKVLGTIGSGKTKSEEFSVVLYGEQGTDRTITAKLSYTLAGSSSTFQKEKVFSVKISSSPLALTIDAPAALASNQPFTLTLRNLFTGDTLLSNVLARVEYPNGFVYQSSSPAPISGNNVWTLGDLQKGAEQTIQIKGKLIGEEGDEKAFRVYVGTPESISDSRIAVVYNSALHSMTLSEPFIASELFINGEGTDIVAVPIGGQVNGTVSWTNTSGERITDPTFTLALSGDSIDTASIRADSGYFDPLSRTLTWNAQSNAVLSVLEPGQTGQLSFSFSTLSARAINEALLALSIKGTFPDRGYTEQSIANIDEATIRYASHLQFASQAFYSVGLIKNTGPFPPKANQETTYTVTWTVRPSENALSSYRASAVLPVNALWSGVVSPKAEPIVYNSETRTVTWDVGVVPRATSTPQSRSVSFQVKVRPTTEQIGLELPLLEPTVVTATDTVANVPLTLTKPELSTRLDADPAYSPGKEKVLP